MQIYIVTLGLYGVSPPIVCCKFGDNLRQILSQMLKIATEEERKYGFPELPRNIDVIYDSLKTNSDYDECESAGIFIHVHKASMTIT
jgi:hypothetical protein